MEYDKFFEIIFSELDLFERSILKALPDIKFYLPIYSGGDKFRWTRQEIEKGHHWLYADRICPECNKNQPVPNAFCSACGVKFEFRF